MRRHVRCKMRPASVCSHAESASTEQSRRACRGASALSPLYQYFSLCPRCAPLCMLCLLSCGLCSSVDVILSTGTSGLLSRESSILRARVCCVTCEVCVESRVCAVGREVGSWLVWRHAMAGVCAAPLAARAPAAERGSFLVSVSPERGQT